MASTAKLWLLHITVLALMLEAIARNTTEYRIRRQAEKCKISEFQCVSGGCIPFSRACDGKPDCPDNSDERYGTCRKTICPAYLFQCGYGACIDKSSTCDGKRDCFDNSDELLSECPGTACKECEAACSANEFGCKSGECISTRLVCDGVKDCNDGSDETFTHCSSISCPSYLFRCAYGACIELEEMCNDNLGCADESDEEPVLCNRTIPVQPVGEGECRLPRAPANGRISIIGCENTPFEEICQAGSGFPVGQYISVRFECNRGYTLRGEASSTCIDGKWEPQVPVCQLVSESDGDACPPLRSKTLDIQCKDKDGNTVSCNNRVPVGSTASFQCREGYTQPIFPYDQIECRSPGTWSSSLLSCLPDCGTPVPEGELYVVNGQQAEVGEFPWHAAIYIRRRNNQWDFWCGGSLISNEGTVLSAAHCFWDRALKKPASADKFRISLGRYHRDWGTKDRYVQERSVRRIVIHERYQDFSNNYAADIAIVFLEDPITLGNAVRPVCIDWRRLLTREALSDGNIGAVAGWGETETGKPSDTLQSARLPYIEYRKCIEAVPPGFKPLVTPDKFCAGYLNGTSVCKGDSGGGLAFQSNDHWYVQGIVSVGVKNGLTCDHNQYTVFTQVSEHIEFLRKELTSSSNVGKPTWD